MRAVTGASGFLGGELVRALLRQGAERVRCLVRPGTDPARLAPLAALGPRVQVIACRLDDPAGLAAALAGVRVLHHLAAAKRGSPAALVAGTVIPTEHVLRAAVRAAVERAVLVSSFSVLGVAGLRRGATVDETTPLDPRPEARDAYAFAKHRQERLAWRLAAETGMALAVVRPGFVFGPGQELLGARIGLRLPGLFLHLGGCCPVPLTFVENCAEAVALAGTAPGAAGRALCIVDDDLPDSRTLLARYRREVEPLRAVPVPYPALRLLALINGWYSRRTAGHLPPVLTPYKVASLWRPQRFTNGLAKEVLGWTPRVSMAEALDRTFAALARSRTAPAGKARGRPAETAG
jgi:nucleoside-diphosphate-sugar epimerase